MLGKKWVASRLYRPSFQMIYVDKTAFSLQDLDWKIDRIHQICSKSMGTLSTCHFDAISLLNIHSYLSTRMSLFLVDFITWTIRLNTLTEPRRACKCFALKKRLSKKLEKCEFARFVPRWESNEIEVFDDRKVFEYVSCSCQFTGHTLLNRNTLPKDTFCRRRAAVGVDFVGEGVGGGNSEGISHSVGARKARRAGWSFEHVGEMFDVLFIPWVKMHHVWVKFHSGWVKMELYWCEGSFCEYSMKKRHSLCKIWTEKSTEFIKFVRNQSTHWTHVVLMRYLCWTLTS